MAVKDVLRKYNEVSLVKRILIGLVVGALLGLFAPKDMEVVTLLGTLFVSALKAVAPVLVFFLVISALANAKAAGSMKTVVLLYLVSTLVASLVAVVAKSSLFPTTLTLVEPAVEQASPAGVGEVLVSLVTNVVSNPVGALMNANYIGILAWAVVLGIALRAASATTQGRVLQHRRRGGHGGALGHRPGALRHPGTGVHVGVPERPRDLHRVRAAGPGAGRLHAVHRVRDEPRARVRLRAQEPLPAGAALFEGQRHHRLLHAQFGGEHPGQHGAVPQAGARQGQLLRFHPPGRHHQHGGRGRHHRGHDHGGGPHAGRGREPAHGR